MNGPGIGRRRAALAATAAAWLAPPAVALAVVIVLGVSFVALGLHFKPFRLDWRPGLVVGITIPLVLAITFVVMYYWGIGLHKISLGSLIIALGLLVDDAIIVVENVNRHLEDGMKPVAAAIQAARELGG